MTAEPMTYIEAALHRALVRTAKQLDLTNREAVQVLLRELFDGERVYLKEIATRPSATPRRDSDR